MAALANTLSKLAVPGIIALGIAQSSIYDGKWSPELLLLLCSEPERDR